MASLPIAAKLHWQDAKRKDWLDLVVHNNMALVLCAEEQWEDALHEIEKAYSIYQYHPIVDSNIGFCHFKLGDLSAANFWLHRAHFLNPRFGQVSRRLAEWTLEKNHNRAALKHSLNALSASPNSRESRLLTAKILDILGNSQEAERHQAYAKTLPDKQPLSEYLITESTRPPWNLAVEVQNSSILERLQIRLRTLPSSSNLSAYERWFERTAEGRDPWSNQ